MKQKSIDRWRERIARAVALLDARLENPPSLQELAAAAAISPFHLHRMWRSLLGETVAQTVRRVRLEASEHLLNDERSITEVALASGFATPQSYSRAFRRRTGMTPSEHRAQRQSDVATQGETRVILERRDEVLVVALRRHGKPYEDLNPTFGAVWSWADERSMLPDLTGIYGVPWDDPVSVPIESLRYDACLSFAATASPTEPFHLLTLPAGEYARVRYQGSYDALERVDQHLVGEWLPDADREPADFPIFHQFLNDPDATPADELLTDVWLLLKQR